MDDELGGGWTMSPGAMAIQFTLENIVAMLTTISDTDEQYAYLRDTWNELSDTARFQLFTFATFDLALVKMSLDEQRD